MLPEAHKVSLRQLGPHFALLLLTVGIQTGSDSDETALSFFSGSPFTKIPLHFSSYKIKTFLQANKCQYSLRSCFFQLLCCDPMSFGPKVFFFFLIYLFFNFYLFIYFWLRWVFVAARGLSLVVASGGYSSLQCTGSSLRWLLLLQSTGSRHAGFNSCGSWAQ